MRTLPSRAITALGTLLLVAPATVVTPAGSIRPGAAVSRTTPLGAALTPAFPDPAPPPPPGGRAAGAGAVPARALPPPGGRVIARRVGSAARFDWPLAGPPRPVRRFDPPPQPWLPGHRGVDLAAAPGAEVHAAGAGVVLFAGTVAGRPVVTVGHTGGLRTTYEPVRSRLPTGARVTTGTAIGTLLAGHPGCPAEACLHWGLRRGEEYLDPLALLGLGPVRLLPLDPGSGG